MHSKQLFHEHLELWGRSNPKEALLMPYIDVGAWQFCKAENGDINLLSEQNGKVESLYDQSDPTKEANAWFQSLSLKTSEALYIYGLGLGYYYRAAKEWLHADMKRALIFLEDDPAILRRFFETELAGELLKDLQVQIAYLPNEDSHKEILTKIYWTIPFAKAQVSALQFYQKKRHKAFEDLYYEISYGVDLRRSLVDEYLEFGAAYFINCYQNILSISSSYNGNHLRDKFKGVPAIICGAGPSLEKNMSILKELKERALIFAGGSSINVLNCGAIQPHLCAGIDPNEAQNVRLHHAQAYEVPFFYRNRLNRNAFKTIHGPHLYMVGSGGYDIAKYFESRFGIEGDDFEEGHSVISFCLEIAHRLGCDPIIFMGMDLAFTDRRTYSEGVIFDPAVEQKTLDEYANFETTGLLRKDINGNPMYTLWKWIAESEWIGDWAKQHPEVKIFNCTEGGLGFPYIENRSINEIAAEFFQRQFDLQGRIHGEIQNSEMPQISEVQALESLVDLKESLIRSREDIQVLMEDVQRGKNVVENDGPPPLQSGRAALAEVELGDEPAYQYVIGIFNQMYACLLNRELELIKYDKTLVNEQQRFLRRMDLNLRRFEFLLQTIDVNLSALNYALEQYEKEKKALPKKISCEALTHSESKDFLEIIKWKNPDFKGETETTYYDSGAIKTETHYKEGVLDGLSTFYSEKGQLLSQASFVRGKLEGEVLWFYLCGAIYSRQNYLKDCPHGSQSYFYRDGTLKTQLEYEKGTLLSAQLYSKEGNLKRNIS